MNLKAFEFDVFRLEGEYALYIKFFFLVFNLEWRKDKDYSLGYQRRWLFLFRFYRINFLTGFDRLAFSLWRF